MSLGQIGGGAGGAGIGALIGSVVPGIGTLVGALWGFAIGSMIGGMVDPPSVKAKKIRPAGVDMQTSEYGKVIPYITGSRKLSGNCIWFGKTTAHKHKRDNGGKGGGGGGEAVYYTYTQSMAFGLSINSCSLIRAWAGKNEIPVTSMTFYDGTQTDPDPTIQAFLQEKGKTRFPVWKNLCYVVFEDFDLGENNVVPNFTFEISRGGLEYQAIEYTSKWGSAGAAAGLLNAPKYIRADGDSIYVCDSGNNRIQKFTQSGTFQKVVVSGLNNPGGFVVDGVYTYICNTGTNEFQWYSLKNYMVQAVTVAGIRDITSISLTTKSVIGYSGGNTTLYTLKYVYQNEHSWLWEIVFTYNLGAWEGTSITGNGTHLFIADVTNNLVRKYTREGILISSFGGSGTGDGQFDKLFGVYASTGNLYNYIYCVDHKTATAKNRLQVFTQAGVFAAETGSFGTGNGQFDDPSGVFEKDGTIYVSDTGNNRIQTFENTRRRGISSYPSDTSEDILTNDFYGAGLSSSLLNTVDFAATTNACTSDDMALDILFDTQQSVLDVLQTIIRHHDGAITYYDGEISHIQLNENSPSVITLNEDDFIKGNNSPYLSILKEGVNNSYNKVVVEYISAEKEYTSATTYANDMPDIDINGLNDITLRLEGFSTHARANKMAQRILNKYRSNLKIYKFALGIKSLDTGNIKPGAVCTIHESYTETASKLVRIMSLSIGPDYSLGIEAIEEIPQTYQVVVIGSGNKEKTTIPQLTAPATDVLSPMILEIPALWTAVNSYMVIYTSPNEIQWAGASLYRSYLSSSGYRGIGISAISGLTGVVVETGVVSGNIAYIDVAVHADDTLESATDFDELISTPELNLAVVSTSTGNRYIRFSDVELIDTNTWRLSHIIYDIVGFPVKNSYGNIANGNAFGYLKNIPFKKGLVESEIDRNLYFKITSYNTKGSEQNIADVDYVTLATTAKADKPLPPFNIKINGIGIDTSNAIAVPSGDIEIQFSSRNRRNKGGTNYGWAYAIKEDVDFSNFAIDIYNGATLLRSARQEGKSFTYTSAMQVEDGSLSAYTIKIKQENIARASDYSDAITVTIV